MNNNSKNVKQLTKAVNSQLESKIGLNTDMGITKNYYDFIKLEGLKNFIDLHPVDRGYDINKIASCN